MGDVAEGTLAGFYLGVEEFALGGAAAVGVEEDVAGVLEEDRSVEVCVRTLAPDMKEEEDREWGSTRETDNLPLLATIRLAW